MTAAHQYGGIDPLDAAIAAEIRADLARYHPRLNQARIAAEVYGRSQQWISRRLVGEVAFTPAELIQLGNYLNVNIVDWMNAAKNGPSTPTGRIEGGQPTRQKIGATDRPLATVTPIRPSLAIAV